MRAAPPGKEARLVRVVTLPPSLPGPAAVAFARAAARAGAGALELRTDLHRGAQPVDALAAELPVLASVRGDPCPERWSALARWRDVPLGPGCEVDAHTLLSYHAERPLAPEQAEALWRASPHRAAAGVKHVEPLGELAAGPRLFETQARLERLLGPGRVTVLAHGPLALPFRAALAARNAFDYLALGPDWAAAEGQRLLADAVREARASQAAGRCRLGIIGAGIAGSRSPRVHRQPFDRIELPEQVDLDAALRALLPLYRGLAVTSPFKRAAAAHVGATLPSVNTLVRRGGRFYGANTDVEGARAVLARLRASEVTVLGDGGVAAALSRAAAELGVRLSVLRRADAGQKVRGAAVWTWPPKLEVPRGLELASATVALICYGPGAVSLGRELGERGATVLRLGPRWFAAQARAQRELWEAAR